MVTPLGARRAIAASVLALCVSATVVLAGCAPDQSASRGQSAAASGAGSAAQTSSPVPQRVVTIVLRAEPPNLSDRLDRMGLGFPITVSLAYLDALQVPQPMLAERLPTQDDGSWTIAADGSMKTVYRLRPNMRWHDGEPLTADDFSFAFQIYTDRDIPMTTRLPESLMSDVNAVDDRTIAITWSQPYVDANALINSQLAPFPRHVLGDLYNQDKNAFLASTFWTSPDFVGSGPYRVTRWDHGVVIALAANPFFPLGKPKIENIEVRWVTDSNTIVAGFFSGTIDFAEYTAIGAEQALILRDRWDQDHGGQIYAQSLFGTRYIEFQHRDVPDHQAALNDVRVRQALMYALDRKALADALQYGFGGVANTGYSESDPFYPRVAQVLTTYPYDVRRADQRLGEAGWARGPDGLYRESSGKSLDVEVRVTGEREQEAEIVADDWKKAGIDARSFVVPRALTTDVEYRVNFPGVAISAQTDVVSAANAITDQAPTPQNKYTGKNRGSYSNPELDRLYAQSLLTIDQPAREKILLDIERIFSADVAQGMLYYQPRVGAARADVLGIKPPVRGSYLWNIWEWSLGPA